MAEPAHNVDVQRADPQSPQLKQGVPQDLSDYPVMEYVATMSAELASMARCDGDEALAALLEGASILAARKR